MDRVAAVEQFLEDLRTLRRASPHTVAAYRRDLATLSSLAAGRSPASLTVHDVRGFMARLPGAGRRRG